MSQGLDEKEIAGLPDEGNGSGSYADFFHEFIINKGSKVPDSDSLEKMSEQERSSYIQDIRFEIAEEIASIHNLMNNLSGSEQNIFDDEHGQKQCDDLVERGLLVLSPDQIQKALAIIRVKNKLTELNQKFWKLRSEKLREAKEKKDLASYLLWFRPSAGNEYFMGLMIHLGCYDPEVLFQEKIKDVESYRPLYESTAKQIRKLYQSIKTLPEDPSKARLALSRLPKEVDPTRPVNILIEYPAGTYVAPDDEFIDKKTGKPFGVIDNKRRIFFSDHPAQCSTHAYDDLYRATRVERKKGEFEARPFYIAAYEAINTPEGFPESARNVLEISFQNGDTLPDTKKRMQELYPDVRYVQKPYIGKDDLQSIEVEDGIAHYMLGKNNKGEVIKQDLIPYAMASIRSVSSNANIYGLEDFLD